MKRVNDNHHVRRVAIAILHYLRDHPTAKDSAAGIAKWWVGEEPGVVEKALALLVKEEILEKKRHVYRLKQNNRTTESKRFGKILPKRRKPR